MDTKSRLYFCGDDQLQRSVYAQNIKSIISKCQDLPKTNDNNSYVIGINAPWGSGKTFFTQMLMSYLQGDWEKTGLDPDARKLAVESTGSDTPADAKEKFSVVYYDAWKNDFWDNAFEPLFDNLVKTVLLSAEADAYALSDILKSAGKIIAYAIKGYAAKKIADYFESGMIDKINEEAGRIWANASNPDYLTSKTFPDYDAFKAAIALLQGYLAKAVEVKKKLVIIIDELDRCKPTFAVQTLEIVKHLFNVEGLVFIFALDIHQLSHCVKVVYGNEFDATGYLERFFNYLTILPHGRFSSPEQTRLFINKMGLQNKYESFDDNLIKSFVKITELFSLSLREVKTVLTTYSVLLETVLAQYTEYPNALILYFYFLCMKYKDPVLFSGGVFSNQSEDVAALLNKKKIPFIDKYEDAEYEKFIKIIGANGKIAETEYYVIKDNKRDRFDSFLENGDIITGVNENIMLTKNKASVTFEGDMSLNWLLYLPDLRRFGKIKDFKVLVYVFRQIEMCDFIRPSE